MAWSSPSCSSCLFGYDDPASQNISVGNIGKGIIYSMVMAIISAGFLFPYCYAPKLGFGFFSFGTPDGRAAGVDPDLPFLVYVLLPRVVLPPTR